MRVRCAWGKCKYNKNEYCLKKEAVLGHEIVRYINAKGKVVQHTFLKCETFEEKEIKL